MKRGLLLLMFCSIAFTGLQAEEVESAENSSDLCPPLPPPSGTVINAADAESLNDAVNNAAAGTTILLADGTYNVHDLILDTPGMTLRSASGNRESVILDGQYAGGSIINIRASNITIADITIRRSWYHPVHVGGGGHYAKLYNLKIIDGKEQFVKVNPNGNQYNDFGEIACSYMELTDAGRQYLQANPTPGFSCYTGGPDLHQTIGWMVRDNTIKGIYCTNGGLAEHAIHFWNTNRDSAVERNKIIDCARGIGFGLGTGGGDRIYPDSPLSGSGLDPSIVDHIGGVIRNNFIFSDIPYYDTGIGLESAWNVTVAHNTIYGKQGNSFNSAIDTRFAASNPILVNNLYYPRKTIRNGGSPTELTNMLATSSMLRDLATGDLHLSDGSEAIDKGTAGYAIMDIDGSLRDSSPDIGADEQEEATCVIVDIYMLGSQINSWKNGQIAMAQLMATINRWKTGCL
jgi:hypothetical protein